MVLPNKARIYRRRPATEWGRKSLNIDMLRQGGSRAKGSRVGDDLVDAFEEMARHLRGEIELEAHDLPGGATDTGPNQSHPLKGCVIDQRIRAAIWHSSAKRLESYEQGRRSLDGAMRALLRIIDREPNAARRALAP